VVQPTAVVDEVLAIMRNASGASFDGGALCTAFHYLIKQKLKKADPSWNGNAHKFFSGGYAAKMSPAQLAMLAMFEAGDTQKNFGCSGNSWTLKRVLPQTPDEEAQVSINTK
jgi:hypothetical protein